MDTEDRDSQGAHQQFELERETAGKDDNLQQKHGCGKGWPVSTSLDEMIHCSHRCINLCKLITTDVDGHMEI